MKTPGAWFTEDISCTSLCGFQLLYWILSKFKALTKLTGYNSLDATKNYHLAAAAERVCGHNLFLKWTFFNSICGKDMAFKRGQMGGKLSLHMDFMKILSLIILIQFWFIWYTYCLFYINTTSDAYPVLNSCVPPASRNTAELDSACVDISNWHLFADIHTSSHLHTCAYSQFIEKIFQWPSVLSENISLLGLKQLVRHSSFVKSSDSTQAFVMAWRTLWAASFLAWSLGYLSIFFLGFFNF